MREDICKVSRCGAFASAAFASAASVVEWSSELRLSVSEREG